MRVGVGVASVPGQWRPEDRVVVGARAWAILGGTPSEASGQNEADVAAPLLAQLFSAYEAPSIDAIAATLHRIDDAVHEWGRALGPDLFGSFLGAIVMSIDDAEVRLVHVGATRAWALRAHDVGTVAAELLTSDHTVAGELRRRGHAEWSEAAGASALFSSLGQGPVARIDAISLPSRGRARWVLTSQGAHGGLETPLGYLAGIASPKECAERICAEARARGSPHHASAVVVELDRDADAPYR